MGPAGGGGDNVQDGSVGVPEGGPWGEGTQVGGVLGLVRLTRRLGGRRRGAGRRGVRGGQEPGGEHGGQDHDEPAGLPAGHRPGHGVGCVGDHDDQAGQGQACQEEVTTQRAPGDGGGVAGPQAGAGDGAPPQRPHHQERVGQGQAQGRERGQAPPGPGRHQERQGQDHLRRRVEAADPGTVQEAGDPHDLPLVAYGLVDVTELEDPRQGQDDGEDQGRGGKCVRHAPLLPFARTVLIRRENGTCSP